MTTWVAEKTTGDLDLQTLYSLFHQGLQSSGMDLSNIAVVPVDKTRFTSRAGELTNRLHFNYTDATIANIFTALGSHEPHTEEDNQKMFGFIPQDLYVEHDWIDGVTNIGNIQISELERICSTKLDIDIIGDSIPIELNTQFIEGMRSGKYSCAVVLGVVFPHEVAGFSNGNKNIFVGLGGQGFIDKTHWMMAAYGVENTLGRFHTPMRELMNMAEERYLKNLHIIYALTVITPDVKGGNVVKGFFVGDGPDTLEKAAEYSKELNVNILPKEIDKAVVYLDPDEYKSFWLGNKAIYRTRMAIKDGGTLYVVAPGISSFADNPKKNKLRDELIATVGYKGTQHVREALNTNPDLRKNTSVAAHLIHGSSEGRFNIIFYTDPAKMPKERVEAVGYTWGGDVNALPALEFEKIPQEHQNIPGFGHAYYVPNPALTLLTTKAKFKEG